MARNNDFQSIRKTGRRKGDPKLDERINAWKPNKVRRYSNPKPEAYRSYADYKKREAERRMAANARMGGRGRGTFKRDY